MNEGNNKTEWFESWFNTKWYHILYKDRDIKEAEAFINKIVENFKMPLTASLLDAACGAGRHAKQLNSFGYKVHGFDLSSESIKTATQYENPNLTFSVADLRTFTSIHKYDGIFSFFTSFGYFDSPAESAEVLKRFRDALAPGGMIMIDFMNAKKSIESLVHKEEKMVESINFHINRKLENGRIIKEINFEAEGKRHSFHERVSAYGLSDFHDMLDSAGLEIKKTFGSYLLEEFSEDSSSRLIILAGLKS